MSARSKLGRMVRLLAAVASLGTASVAGIDPTAAQTAQFDGVYAGTQTLTDKSSDHNYSKCLKGPFKRKLVVKDGAVTYVYNPTYEGTVTGTVSADGDVSGTVSTTGGGVSLSGRIQGNEFTGEVWSVICTYALQMKRVSQ
jgi:hypothetical protein